MDTRQLINEISRTDISKEQRLQALTGLKEKIDLGQIVPDAEGIWVNNHIHTSYSFSPYTPTSAVFYAWKAGLQTAGIMDHDSVAGAAEFIEAGKILQLPVTVGVECRVSVVGTVLEGKRLNNPDQISCAYVAMHGIPHQNLGEVEKHFSRMRMLRNERNRKMCARISELLAEHNLHLDFEKDVLPLSMYHEGGSVTERHIAYGIAGKLIQAYPDRQEALTVLEAILEESLSERTRERLLTAPPQFYAYDMLGVIKSHMIHKFYIPATEECMHITEFTALAKKLGAVSAYAYLGDVGISVTGDKKAAQYEDAYLEDLFTLLKELNFCAVTYMPSRNTMEQLERVMQLCAHHDLFQISGEDINSPRQSFVCPVLSQDCFEHLRVAAYALIGHENAAKDGLHRALFSEESIAREPDLEKRARHYAALGGYTS